MPANDLDTLIAHLKAPGAVVMDVDAKVLASSLEDLKNRVSHVEHSNLRVLANSRIHDDHLKQIDDNVGGITRDRDEFRKQVKVATDLPLAHEKKIEELEARVRSCEGAVGAAPYKPAKAIEPVKPTEAIDVSPPARPPKVDKPLKPAVEPAPYFKPQAPSPAPIDPFGP